MLAGKAVGLFVGNMYHYGRLGFGGSRRGVGKSKIGEGYTIAIDKIQFETQEILEAISDAM